MIDLDSYLRGFPYTAVMMNLRSRRIFYLKTGKADHLMMQVLDLSNRDGVDFSKGRAISEEDFSKRTLKRAFFSPLTGKVILEADDHNDEIFNFYELDLETGKEKMISHTAYIYGYKLSDDGRYIAFSTRSGKDESSRGDVRVLDLVTLEEKILFRDSNEIRMIWGRMSWQPNGQGVLVPFAASGARNRVNLIYVPIDTGRDTEVITDTSTLRTEISPLNRWLNDNDFLELSDEGAFEGVYIDSLKGGHRRLSPQGENIKGAAILEDGGLLHLALISGDPLQSTLKLVSLGTGELWYSESFQGSLFLADVYSDRLELGSVSLNNPFSIVELQVSGRKVDKFERAAYPRKLLEKILNCEPEKVSFETFDKASAPGEAGALHAYLLKPRKPQTGDESRALVESFYGGSNAYSPYFEMLCAAGYYVMSPAPRGTLDFGAAFANLGRGDLGGGETLDDLAAGKFLQMRLGIPPEHIGIFGGSRGGYDVLRAMTFPGEVNGVQENFRFGFGISDSGFADIVRATDGSNIRQWFADLTGGDPHANGEKWHDRSPETHADRLSGPLLLTHGTNDGRIPVTESRAMYAKAKSLGKEVYFLELPGQGHGYAGLDAETTYYQTVFDFLGKIR